MKIKLLILLMMISNGLIACKTTTISTIQPAQRTIEKPAVLEKYTLINGNHPAVEAAYKNYFENGVAKNITGEGFIQFAYGVNQPVVAATPFELTVISLEPGEQVNNVSSGDPLRWSYSLAYSGKSEKRQAHIMIKPTQTNISTDLVITTDKRMYTIKIIATKNGKYVRNVKFWYPLDMRENWEEKQTTIANLPVTDVSKLNFDYSIKTTGWLNTLSWQPTRVFDDGVHTYIQFPANMMSQDMPALFIRNADQSELVNYRSKPPYFIVDKIFKEAELVLGGGRNQQKVTIKNRR